MNVLLLSMPDSFEHMAPVTVRMPNGALASLAGNVDEHHRVAVADLILVQERVAETVDRLVDAHRPDVVGLSVMTFQRHTARRIIARVRARRPEARIVVGGYDPSLAPEAWAECVDFLVRGEGEATFSELLRALEGGAGFEGIRGLAHRSGGRWVTNPPRPVSRPEAGEVRPPNRAARVLGGYTLLGRQVDVVETSRGCTFDCSFCSIVEMRGRNFHPFPLGRVLDDIRDARDRGARAVFLVDDNITLDVGRFEELLRAIVEARLHRVEYLVQAMTSSIASAGATLVPLMKEAGFRYVFLGIENVLDADLGFLKASAKNARREHGRRVGNATQAAIDALHRHGLLVVGGLIVGNPGDTREAVEANLDFARSNVDWPYIQHPTPYPATPMTQDLAQRGLIGSEDVSEYDGTTAVVRNEHLDADEIEFLRWRAERHMKLRHFPVALRHSPWFVLRHARRMLAHTFRGSTWRSALGLESERAAFARYKALRRAERHYL
ncbi:MAG TPA: radical SAM protein [Vicinamibacteria bacterium]|nr:radical SAM protein [Vicinamibacteria bacterium]